MSDVIPPAPSLSPEIVWPFSAISLAVFPFEFLSWTFTVKLYKTCPTRSENLILECSFSFKVVLSAISFVLRIGIVWPAYSQGCSQVHVQKAKINYIFSFGKVMDAQRLAISTREEAGNDLS